MRDILRHLQSPATTPNPHRRSEERLKAVANNTCPNDEKVTYEYENNHQSYWGISHDPNSGTPTIVMPLRISKGDLGVSYASCRHDVVAIHIDTLVPPRKDWNASLGYLSKCINKCLKRLDSDFEGNLPKNNFKLLMFTDFSDLNSQLKTLSVQGLELQNPNLRHAKASAALTGIPSEPTETGLNLRSLHILLPKGPAPTGILDKGLPLSSFFLSVMKEDEIHVDAGEYSTRIDCYYSYQNHQPEQQLANFLNLVHSFLISINIKTENSGPFRDVARIGTIGRFFRQSSVLTNAFSSTNSGDILDDPLSPPPRCFRSFDEFYKPLNTAIHPSAFYKWLNQFNWRLFGTSLQKGLPKDSNWTPRVFFETEGHKIFDLFYGLDKMSVKWKEQTDLHLLQAPMEDTWWVAPLESNTDRDGEPLTPAIRAELQVKAECYSYLETGKGPGGNPLTNSERQDLIDAIVDKPRPNLKACKKHLVMLRDKEILEDILDELIDKGLESQAAQLEFYAHIIELFYKIWNDLSAPYTHHMMTKKFPYLLNDHNVRYLNLLILSFYQDVERLCKLVEVEKYGNLKHKMNPTAWNEYSNWVIARRQ